MKNLAASVHNRYDVPAEFEIIRASEITWRYYKAIMNDQEFFIPATTYDLYEAFMTHWNKLPERLKAMPAGQIATSKIDGNVSPVFVAIVGKRTFMNNYTTNPISTVALVPLQPEYMRLPRPGTRDPVFGLVPLLNCRAVAGRHFFFQELE